MDFAERKPNRSQKYDYDTNGFYFVTICTRDRRRLLSDIVGDDAHIVPKAYGRIAEKYIRNAREIEKYVIMPDHIHMIVRLDSSRTALEHIKYNPKNGFCKFVDTHKTCAGVTVRSGTKQLIMLL